MWEQVWVLGDCSHLPGGQQGNVMIFLISPSEVAHETCSEHLRLTVMEGSGSNPQLDSGSRKTQTGVSPAC